MRKLLFAAVAAACFCTSGHSQTQPEPHPVIMTTFEYTPPSFGDTTFKNVNIDTLIAYYVDKGIRPNTLMKNFRLLVHYWGRDSYKVIFLYEVDKWEDINKSETKTTELLDASFKNEADKKLFWRRIGKLFDRHEDNIMSDWVKPKM